MQLTTKGRYAVMAILEMATTNNKSPIPLNEIASKQNIPISYLEQIFLKLKKAGLVNSIKGPKGGYFIQASLSEIKIAHIIDAVEENIKMTRCQLGSQDNRCMPSKAKCNSHYLWCGLTDHIRSYLEAITLADVMSRNKGLFNDLPRS